MKKVNEWSRGDHDTHSIFDHKFVLGEYGRILGATGLALYMVHKTLADSGQTASIRELKEHLSIGQQTINHYNQLLQLLGLIEIQPGDQTKPNRYIVYRPSELGPIEREELLEELKKYTWFNKQYNKPICRRIVERIKSLSPAEVQLEPIKRTTVPPPQLYTDYKDLGFEKDQVLAWLDHFGIAYMRSWYEYFQERQHSDQPIQHPRAWLTTCIEGGKLPDWQLVKVKNQTNVNQDQERLRNQVPPEYAGIVKE